MLPGFIDSKTTSDVCFGPLCCHGNTFCQKYQLSELSCHPQRRENWPGCSGNNSRPSVEKSAEKETDAPKSYTLIVPTDSQLPMWQINTLTNILLSEETNINLFTTGSPYLLKKRPNLDQNLFCNGTTLTLTLKSASPVVCLKIFSLFFLSNLKTILK